MFLGDIALLPDQIDYIGISLWFQGTQFTIVQFQGQHHGVIIVVRVLRISGSLLQGLLFGTIIRCIFRQIIEQIRMNDFWIVVFMLQIPSMNSVQRLTM